MSCHSCVPGVDDGVGGPKAVAFIIGVSSHNVLEGLTLGLQTELNAATSMFSAILLHGFLLSTAVTVALMKVWLKSGLSHGKAAIYIGLLVALRLVGGLLGLAIVGAPGFLAIVLSSVLQVRSSRTTWPYIHVCSVYRRLCNYRFPPKILSIMETKRKAWLISVFYGHTS